MVEADVSGGKFGIALLASWNLFSIMAALPCC
jgi:hypothetical protein